jgi:hypothetical protein
MELRHIGNVALQYRIAAVTHEVQGTVANGAKTQRSRGIAMLVDSPAVLMMPVS